MFGSHFVVTFLNLRGMFYRDNMMMASITLLRYPFMYVTITPGN